MTSLRSLAFWRRTADSAYSDLQNSESLRDSGLMLAAGAWVLSLLDTWLLFPNVDVGPAPVVPLAADVPYVDASELRAAVTIGF